MLRQECILISQIAPICRIQWDFKERQEINYLMAKDPITHWAMVLMQLSSTILACNVKACKSGALINFLC